MFIEAARTKEKLHKLGVEFESKKLQELRENQQIEKENLEKNF